MKRHHFTVREFRNGDESEIVEFFNTVYRGYSGFVPRTIDYWRWCILERPDVSREGILLALDEERLCGYLVAGSSGNVWELCVADSEKGVAEALLSAAETYYEKTEVSSIGVNLPSNSGMVEELHEAGFREVAGLQMFVTTLNPADLVDVLVKSKKEIVAKRLEGEFSVHLLDVPNGAGDGFSVRARDSSIEVTEGCSLKRTVFVELKFMDFLSIILRNSSAVRLLLTGKMKVRPFWKSGAVLRLLSTMRLTGPWFFPLSDSM